MLVMKALSSGLVKGNKVGLYTRYKYVYVLLVNHQSTCIGELSFVCVYVLLL